MASGAAISTPVKPTDHRCIQMHRISTQQQACPTRQMRRSVGASGAPFTHGTGNFSQKIFQCDVLQAFLVSHDEQFFPVLAQVNLRPFDR